MTSIGTGDAPWSAPDLFAVRAASVPEAVAVVQDGRAVTYAQLDERANRLAHLLTDAGAGRGAAVAVLMRPSPDLVMALLAILKTGAAYVPIAPDDPPERVAYILADSAASITITDEGEGTTPRAGEHTRLLRIGDPAVEEALRACPATAAGLRKAGRSDPAYIIYTSGSTGRPKGVVVEHSALAAYLDYARTVYPSAAGRTLLHSSVSFDLAVTSLYPPLLAGGTIDIVDLVGLAAGNALPPGFVQPSLLKITPSHLALLRRLPPSCSPSDQLIVGGEALFGASLDEWRARHPGVTVINEYGPTEATVGCCIHVVAPDERLDPGAVPIGVPVSGTELHVLDDARRPVPDGQAGELYIAGAQLARGYLNRPELTARCFVADPLGPPGSRMYRTGDRVRRRPGGELEFLGRTDDQVKIGGHRVELGEVEAALRACDSVSQAAVVVRADGDGPARLVAYVIGASGYLVDQAALRRSLADRLPDYMLPAGYLVVAELPLTANGKVDRTRLPELVAEPGYVPARTPGQRLLCELIEEIVDVDRVGIDDDFLALGGSSIAAARLVTRARKAGLEIRLVDVLRRRNVRSILEGSDHV
jgi:amino acid adenylation domain-containing protein